VQEQTVEEQTVQEQTVQQTVTDGPHAVNLPATFSL
jgi:hypothetical protein